MSVSTLKISVNGQFLDLFEGSEKKFFITRVVNDLRDLETRNGSFTRNLEIPNSNTNINIFKGLLPGLPLIAGLWVKKIAEIRYGGVVLASHADIFLIDYKPEKYTINIRMFLGSTIFFDQINTLLLTDLDWSSFIVNWDRTGLETISGAHEKWCYADMDWVENADKALPRGISSEMVDFRHTSAVGVQLYTKEIIKKIVEEAGFTLDITNLIDDDYTDPEGLEIRSGDIVNGSVILPEYAGQEAFIFYESIGDVSGDFIVGQQVTVYHGKPPPADPDEIFVIIKTIRAIFPPSAAGKTFLIFDQDYEDDFDNVGLLRNKIPEYEDMAIGIPISQFVNLPALTTEDAVDLRVDQAHGATTIVVPRLSSRKFDQFTDPVDPLWNTTQQGYVMDKDYSAIRFTFQASRTTTILDPYNNRIVIKKNNIDIATHQLTQTFTLSGGFSIQVTTSALAGDVITFWNENGSNEESVFDVLDIVDSRLFARMDNQSVVGSDIDVEVQLINYLPEDISQRKIFAEILKIMNIIVEIDDVLKTVKLKRFDSSFELENASYNYFLGNDETEFIKAEGDTTYINAYTEATMQDWSRLMDKSREARIFNFIPKWFKKNKFSWDKSFVWRKDTDAFFDMRNESLKEQGDKILSMFAATDDSLLLHTSQTQEPAGRNPTYQFDGPIDMGPTAQPSSSSGTLDFFLQGTANLLDVRVGDYMFFTEGGNNDGKARRIISLNAAVNQGQVDIVWPAGSIGWENWSRYRFQGGIDFNTGIKIGRTQFKDTLIGFQTKESIAGIIDSIVTVHKRMIFTERMTWGSLLNNYYSKLLAGLKFPLMVQAWFIFDVIQFQQIEMTQVVYVQPLNGIFWINKIEQYKAGKPVRVELIRMNTIIEAGQILLPIGGEPLEIELQGLLTQ